MSRILCACPSPSSFQTSELLSAALKSSPSKKGRSALLAVKPSGPMAAFSASLIPSEKDEAQYDLRGARSYPTLDDEGNEGLFRCRFPCCLHPFLSNLPSRANSISQNTKPPISGFPCCAFAGLNVNQGGGGEGKPVLCPSTGASTCKEWVPHFPALMARMFSFTFASPSKEFRATCNGLQRLISPEASRCEAARETF